MPKAPGRNAGAATEPAPTPFRFYDNRQKYLAFVTACNEKSAIARRAAGELAVLQPTPPAVRLFDAGMGDGTAIAHARVEEPHGGRRRLQHGQLAGGAPRNRRLLVAGGHEGQVLLAVVVEAKRSRGRLGGRTGIPARRLGHGASAPEPRG